MELKGNNIMIDVKNLNNQVGIKLPITNVVVLVRSPRINCTSAFSCSFAQDRFVYKKEKKDFVPFSHDQVVDLFNIDNALEGPAFEFALSKKINDFIIYKNNDDKGIMAKNKHEAADYIDSFYKKLNGNINTCNERTVSAREKCKLSFSQKLENWIKFGLRNNELREERLQILEAKNLKALRFMQRYFWIFFIKAILSINGTEDHYETQMPIIKLKKKQHDCITRVQKMYRRISLKNVALKQSGYHTQNRFITKSALCFIANNIKQECRYYAFETIKSFMVSIINPLKRMKVLINKGNGLRQLKKKIKKHGLAKSRAVDKVDTIWEKECLYINELHYNLLQNKKITDTEA